MNIDFQEILKELEFRLPNGIINLNEEHQVTTLVEILRENGVPDANEFAQRARVIFGYVNEASKKKAATKKTGTKFPAFSKDGEKLVYFKTKASLDTALKKGSHITPKQKEENDKQKAASKPGKKQQPQKIAAADFKTDLEKEKPEKEINWSEAQTKAKKINETIYGKNNKGPLLQNSATSDAALQNGYTEGEWWVAPGNAGSNFNENMSNEACKVLEKHPDLDEQTLAMVIFNKTKNSKLANQQSDPAIKSQNKIKVPPGLSKEEQILYKNCVITARSGRAKYDRAMSGVQAAGMGKDTTTMSFGGTSRKDNTPAKVKTDRDNMLSEVDSAKNCYIYDNETNKAYKVDKEELKKWINSSGGGENAADTVVMTKDKNGNLLYDGWSDKKTLGDLQANGTLYNDMIQSGIRVDEMIKSGQISSADAKKSKEIIDEGTNKIKMIERGYSTISSNHAKYHLSLSEKEFQNMEKSIASDTDTKKHYKNWSETLKKVIAGSGKSDAKSVAIAEEISGIKRKKSKEELDADKFVQDTLDKYGEDTTATLLKSEEVPDEIKQQIKKAQDAGKKGRAEYMNEFNGWLSKNKSKLKSISPFEVLNNVQIKAPNVISENERKLIDRAAAKEREKFAESGKKLPKTLDTQGALETMRKEAFNAQRDIFEKLSKISAKTMAGDKTNAAAALGFRDAVAALHLDKIDLPKNDKDIHQILKRSTNLVMEGITVSPKTIKDCLGVDNTKDLEKHFVVDFKTDKFIKNKEGFVTGKTIAIYLVDKNNQRKEISPKVFRPKAGPQAKTSNTLAWSDDMQKCFDSKNKRK